MTVKKPINDLCPWSGKPVSLDALTTYRGHVVGFCNLGCRSKFRNAIDAFDRQIEAVATPSAREE